VRLRSTSSLFFVAFAMLSVAPLAACSAEGEGTSEGGDELTGGGSYVGTAVVARLRAEHAKEEGVTWSDSNDARFDGDWLQQIPALNTWGSSNLAAAPSCAGNSCDSDFVLRTCTSNADCGGSSCAPLRATVAHEGDAPRRLCVGPSDGMLDTLYDTIVAAKQSVDVSSLTGPDGRFEAMLRNATTRLSERASPPTVRYIFGSFPGGYLNVSETLRNLARDVKNPQFQFVVGSYNTGPTTWNHAKIVTIDGEKVFTGGMNMWTPHYLEGSPVHDLNIAVHGSAARAATLFVDTLWDGICNTPNTAAAYPDGGDRCLPSFAKRVPAAKGSGSKRVIAVGRLGNRGDNPGDDALVALIDAAKGNVKISQQDVSPIKRAGLTLGSWNYDVFDAINRAAIRGVDVDIVVSNEGAFAGASSSLANSYFNGFTIADVWNVAQTRAVEVQSGKPDPTNALCKHLRVMYFRSSANATWASGTPQANHAKNVFVDDRAFYVGSQNIYKANLAEFGVIVDDSLASSELTKSYWTPLLKYARPTTYIDARCR
jgi:phosphatidylserine/phosphatidylglycerophosphate/cardiolipin synthase-like enzyme